jgi:hypothetical protein
MPRVCDDGRVNPSEPPEPAPQAALRASDADRDRVADRLREALAEGRITPEEHAERIDVVYRAKTYADLEPVLSDLPGGPGAASAPAPGPTVRLDKDARLPAPERLPASVLAIFGGADRKGRWLVEPSTTVTCVFGGIRLDFRRAVLSQREVTINVSCLFGGVEIVVPPGVRVVSSVSAVLGGTDVPEDDTLAADAPVIRLTGMVIFGGVSASRKEPGEKTSSHGCRHHGVHDHRSLRREIREQKRAMREDIREHVLREMRDQRHENLRHLRDSRRRHC